MHAAVHYHHLAIDRAGAVRDQKAGEIGQFNMLAGAAKRIARRPVPVASLGVQLPRGVGERIASAARNERCSLCAMEVAVALLTMTLSGAFSEAKQ
jgi:hypothetical protein